MLRILAVSLSGITRTGSMGVISARAIKTQAPQIRKHKDNYNFSN